MFKFVDISSTPFSKYVQSTLGKAANLYLATRNAAMDLF